MGLAPKAGLSRWACSVGNLGCRVTDAPAGDGVTRLGVGHLRLGSDPEAKVPLKVQVDPGA